MDWPKAMREKAQGSTDAAFWNASAYEIETLRQRVKQLEDIVIHWQEKYERERQRVKELEGYKAAWLETSKRRDRAEKALIAERAISDKLEKALEQIMLYAPQWPDDAPEWANYITTVYLEDSVDTGRISTISRIERPKPAKQKCKYCGSELE